MLLKTAENYIKQGYSIIPLKPKSKIPLGKWGDFQKKHPVQKELEIWFKNTANNIGVVTGNISKLVVVDIDDKEMDLSKLDLPKTSIIETARGFHFYYKLSLGKEIKNTVGLHGKNIDIRGEGGYVVGVGSIHESGFVYKYAINHRLFKIGEPTEAPEWLLEGDRQKTQEDLLVPNKEKALLNRSKGVSQGERNQSSASMAGLLLKKHSEKIAWELLVGWNTKNSPPLSDRELRATFNSILQKEQAKNGDKKEKTNTQEDKEVEKFKPCSYKELLEKEFSPIEWIVDGLIPPEVSTIITGDASVYKTWLLIEIAIKVATGEKCLGKFGTSKMNVLFIDEDNGERLLHQRIKLFGNKKDLPISFLSYTGFQIKPEHIDQLLEIIKEKDIKLVIMDVFRNFHDNDENSSTEMAPVLKQLKRINKEGVTVILAHHDRKSGKFTNNDVTQRIRGTTAFRGFFECHLVINPVGDEVIEIVHSKIRNAKKVSPFTVRAVFEKDNFYFDYLSESEGRKNKKKEIKELIKEALCNDVLLSVNELYENIKGVSKDFISERTYLNARNEMVKAKELFEGKGDGAKKLLSLTPFDKKKNISTPSLL